MKFRKLNEEYTADDLYETLADYIYENFEETLDNLAVKAVSDIDYYDADYCSESPDSFSNEGFRYLRKAAEKFAEHLLVNAPDVIHESITEDRKDLADKIRKGKLKHSNTLVDNQDDYDEIKAADEYDPDFGFEHAEDGDTKIQLQDREHRDVVMRRNNKKFEKSPRVSSHTWGRIWKNNKLEKQFEGPKYKVRQDMVRYLDSEK